MGGKGLVELWLAPLNESTTSNSTNVTLPTFALYRREDIKLGDQ